MLRYQLQKLGLAERLMHDAHARPQQHLAPELAVEIAAQMAVRAEDDLLAFRDLADDRLGARRGHDDVGERLHRRRAIDVGQRDMVGVRLAKAFELFGRTAVLEAASRVHRSEEHTSELQSLMRISYAVFCLKKKKSENTHIRNITINVNKS